MNSVTNGATAAPATTEAKPKQKLVLSELTYDEIVSLAVDEQDALIRTFDHAVKRQEKVKQDYKSESKYAAILLEALEVRVKRGIEANIYPSTFTGSALYEQVAGQKPPTHVRTMKNCYASFVRNGFVSEQNFRLNSNNCLELAARIADAVVKANGVKGLDHDAVRRAAHELTTREGDGKEATNLRAILASVKPAKKLTADEALEMFRQIVTDCQLAGCLPQLPDLFPEMPETEQRATYIAIGNAVQRIDKAMGETVEEWTNAVPDIAIMQAGVQVGTVEAQPEELAVA